MVLVRVVMCKWWLRLHPDGLALNGKRSLPTSLGSFVSYLAGDVPSRESPQGRDGCGGDGGGTLLGVVQESGDGFGEHRVPQGQQVNDRLGLLLGAS